MEFVDADKKLAGTEDDMMLSKTQDLNKMSFVLRS